MVLKKRHKLWCMVERCLLCLARHPVVSSVCILSSITIVGSVILIHVEPKTFKSVGDGLWFTYISLLGIGYGDIVPHTWQGRTAAAPLLLLGIVSVSIFTAIVELFFLRPFLRIGPNNSLLLKEIQQLKELVESEQNKMQTQIELQESQRTQFQTQQEALLSQLQALVTRLEEGPKHDA